MCGIAGFLSIDSGVESPFELEEVAGRMADVMTPRGPDDKGTWADSAAGIGLGFRRLAIVDLSPAGHQPMTSRSGRFVMVFNGEIYNHLELRRCLELGSDVSGNANPGMTPRFRGRSDSEVLLAGIESWGFEAALRRTVGMFAVAVWDRRKRMLLLARDRMGEKPLYYGLGKRSFLFGSEIKALQSHGDFDSEIDRNALQLYMRHGCISAPHSIYRGIHKLIPGCTLAISASHIESKCLPPPEPYWTVEEAALSGLYNQTKMNECDAVDELERLLQQSISGQMLADVPVGAFLSGGIDSSTVVALMQSSSSRPVKTFSIGFNEPGYNEAEHARRIAEYLGTDHTEMYVTPSEARSVIPQLPTIYDEPFADMSQIPTILVSQLARRQVTVALSGDGGDELFEGYPRYAVAERLWQMISLVPAPLRTVVSQALDSRVCARVLNSRLTTGRLAGQLGVPSRLNGKLSRLVDLLRSSDSQQVYRSMMSYWTVEDAVVHAAVEPYTVLNDTNAACAINSMRRRVQFLDQVGYLPDDILTKVDRAAMSVSLETRIPLLDHRIVEFSWRLPKGFLRRSGVSKWILRQVLKRYVPAELTERPKMGFGVPIGAWLRGPIRDWAESLLNTSSLANGGLLNVPIIRRRWKEHLSGQRDWQQHLWAVLMFQAWQEHSKRTVSDLRRVA